MSPRRAPASPFRTPAAPAAPAPPRSQLATAGRLLLGVAVNAVVCGVVALLSPILAMFVAVIVGMAFLVSGELDDMGPAFTAFLTIAAAGLMSALGGLGELALWSPSGDIPVAAAPSHRDARVFTFLDATARPALGGRAYESGHRGPGRSYRVVPLVPPAWTPADPVPAWAACAGPSCGAPTPAPRFGARVTRFDADAFDRAVHDAAARHRLRVAPGAPVLQVGASAEEVVRARLVVPGLATGIFAAAWLVALGYARVRRWRAPGA